MKLISRLDKCAAESSTSSRLSVRGQKCVDLETQREMAKRIFCFPRISLNIFCISFARELENFIIRMQQPALPALTQFSAGLNEDF